LSYFLHKQGYNFFTIGKLTYGEIEALVTGWNMEQEEKEKAYKESSKKGKKRR
jgi:hypothetical protein